MARDKDQVFIFSKGELALIKTVFGDNDELLYAIRKVFLQFPLTEAETKLVQAQVTPEVLAVIRKRILPDFSEDFPLTQIPDFFSTLTADMEKFSVADMAPIFASKDLQEDYLAQQLEVFADLSKAGTEDINLAQMRVLKGKDPETQFVHTKARNYLLGYIDPMLNHLKTLAGTKDETPEEQEKRLKRDSNK